MPATLWTKIASLVAGLAVIGAGVYLLASGADDGAQAAILIAAGLGIMTLPRANEPNSPSSRDRKPPAGGGPLGGAVVLLAVVATASTASACGPSTYRDAAVAGGGLGRVLGATQETMINARARDLDGIAESVRGQTTAEITAALDAGVRRWSPVLAGYDLARTAWLAYLDGLETAHALGLGGADLAAFLAPMLSRAVQLAANVLDVWRLACVSSAGDDASERDRCTERIPSLPGWILAAARGLEALSAGSAPPSGLIAAGGAQ